MEDLSDKIVQKLIDSNEPISDQFVNEKVDEFIKESNFEYLKQIKKNERITLDTNRKHIKGFEDRLFKRWKQAFDVFEILIQICIQSGNYLKNSASLEQREGVFFFVIFKLHTRAIQIANEILILLKGGFSEGALTRWRSLHEIVVTAHYIREGGCELAIRYLDHSNIINYKEAIEYNEKAKFMGFNTIPDKDIESLTEIKDNLIEKYGDKFKKDYGWTINDEDWNFMLIEKKVKLDHLRPHYKNASNFVHGNSKGILTKPSILKEELLMSVILTGGTNYGLSYPGQNAAISLGQINTLFLNFSESFEKLKFMNATNVYVEKCKEVFIKIDKEIEKEENV